MLTARYQAGYVGHIYHQERSRFSTNLGKTRKIDYTWISTGAGNDQFRFIFTSQCGYLIVVDAFILSANAVVDDPIEFAGKVQMHAVCQVSAVGQVHR